MKWSCVLVLCALWFAPPALACGMTSKLVPFEVVAGSVPVDVSSPDLPAPVAVVTELVRGIGSNHATCDDTGLLTALFRWQPGTVLALHEHVEIEQSYVLEGEFEDDDGVYPAGNFAWRPKGHRHIARSPKGALVLCFFLKPNKFLGGELDGVELK